MPVQAVPLITYLIRAVTDCITGLAPWRKSLTDGADEARGCVICRAHTVVAHFAVHRNKLYSKLGQLYCHALGIEQLHTLRRACLQEQQVKEIPY